MARRYWLFRQAKARYPTLEAAVRDQILDAAEDAGIDVETETLTGYQTHRLFAIKYEWEITPESDTYVLVERQFITVWWYVLFGLILTAFATVITSTFIPGIPYAALFPVAAIMVFGVGLLLQPFFYTSPIEETMPTNEAYRMHPAAPILVMAIALAVVGTLLFVWLTLTTQPNFWAVTFLLVVTDGLAFVVFRRQSSLWRFDPDQLLQAYNLLGGYLAYILFGVMPASVLIALQPRLVPSPSVRTPSILLVGVNEVLILGFMYRFLIRDRKMSYYKLRAGEETIQRPIYRFPILLLVIGASYGMLVILLVVVQRFARLVSLAQPGISMIVILAVLPLLYMPIGVVLQSFTFLRETIMLFRTSTPTAIATPVEITPQVRLVEADQYIAGSYSLGFKAYIFVSTTLVNDLAAEELGAVLAHEEGHINHHDAFLSFLVPLVAGFLMTGQNVVYTALDFRTREFRADRYAAVKAGEDQLIQALRTMASQSDAEADRETIGSTPTFVSVPPYGDTGWLDRFFGTFFGNFALTEAHPGFEERINRIQ